MGLSGPGGGGDRGDHGSDCGSGGAAAVRSGTMAERKYLEAASEFFWCACGSGWRCWSAAAVSTERALICSRQDGRVRGDLRKGAFRRYPTARDQPKDAIRL